MTYVMTTEFLITLLQDQVAGYTKSNRISHYSVARLSCRIYKIQQNFSLLCCKTKLQDIQNPTEFLITLLQD